MPSDRCFVAHADILGFRSMVRRNPEAAWTTLSELAEIRNYLSRLSLMRIEVAAPELLIDRVSSVMFSDTIMLFTKSESDVDLQAILIACCELLHAHDSPRPLL